MENAYLLAYKRSYRKLLLVLPIDKLVPLIKDKDSLKRVVIKNDATREEQSRCLLEFVMEELKEGRAASFEQLLEVMAAQVDASNNIVLDRVLQSIHMDVKAIMNQSEQTPHEGELVPNLKEQFLQQLKQEVSSYNSKLPTGSAGVIRWSGNIGPIKRDAPNLIQSLKNSKNCIRWTEAASAPRPIYSATAVVHNYKVYIAGCSGPGGDVYYKVFMYDIANNKWSTLPDPKQLLAVHEIIGGRLTLVGGQDCETDEISKSLSSYDDSNQTWIKHFPDMLNPRNRCSVVKHGNSVIVAGGTNIDACLSTIEVMNIIEMRWREVATHLPCPMWNMSTTICDNEMYIIGYAGEDNMRHKATYRLSADDIVHSTTAKSWKFLLPPPRLRTTVVSHSNPPLIIGGNDQLFDSVADVNMFNAEMNTWTLVDTLKTPRAYSIVAAIDDKAIIVIGGCHKAKNRTTCMQSAIATVEIGQAVPRDDHFVQQNDDGNIVLPDDNNIIDLPDDIDLDFVEIPDEDVNPPFLYGSSSPDTESLDYDYADELY
ncbi:uncharacterized protein [Dysidea avara]|uniref:uncharacterized protein isoform X1 n=1 Tax=Dysidea avara TaxID=196820 RepID=UPI0033290E52